MIEFRPLHTSAEHQAFLDGFCRQLARRSKGALVLDARADRIARCTRVMGIFDGRGELVGGYVVNDGPPLVLLSVIPDARRRAWTLGVDLDDVCELNLIWRGEGIGHTTFALLVWPRIIADCLARGRRLILGSGYRNPLDRWYRALHPELLYEGPSATSGLTIFVYAFTRRRLVGTYFVSLLDDLATRWRRHGRGRR